MHTSEMLQKPTPVAEYSATEAALSDLAARFKGVVYDVRTRDGMKDAVAARAELREYRVNLEKLRVEIKAPALERCRLIDAEAKRITSALVALEDPIDTVIKQETSRKDQERIANEERIAAIQQSIADLNAIVPSMAGASSARLTARIAALQDYDVAEWAEEFLADAQKAHQSAIAALQQLHAGALAQEQAAAEETAKIAAERAELEVLRKEQQERARAEQARIAEETRKRAEEEAAARAVIEAEQRAARQRIEAEERAARQAREEQDRKARQEREAEETRLKAEREMLEAQRRELQKEENEKHDARAMLETFRTRFGHRKEYARVVTAINACLEKVAA